MTDSNKGDTPKPAPTLDDSPISKGDLVATLDKEIDVTNDAQKHIGHTKWALLLAIGGLLLMLAELWKAGSINLASSLSLFIALTVGVDGLLTLLRHFGTNDSAAIRHWYDPPFRIAIDPPLAGILHNVLIILAALYSASSSNWLLTWITILFISKNIFGILIYTFIYRFLAKINNIKPFRRGVRLGSLTGKFYEPILVIGIGIWHCTVFGLPAQGTTLAPLEFGVLLFLIVSLLAHLIRPSERSRLDALQSLRRFISLGDITPSDGKLAFTSTIEGMPVATSIIIDCTKITNACTKISAQLHDGGADHDQFNKKVDGLALALNQIRIELVIYDVISPTATQCLALPFTRTQQALNDLSGILKQQENLKKPETQKGDA